MWRKIGGGNDAQQLYERSIGLISNGFDVGGRPSALYLASDLPTQASSFGGVDAQRGGYVELDYGVGGNVEKINSIRTASRDGSAILRNDPTDVLP